ncbi:MAG TPA: DUF4097 family beta strand repeat-containing protein [Acidimicrobiia bacterium]|nr:DUF4097 family beta strand repeat-containing protein [Acidimicrobiia bacterium]
MATAIAALVVFALFTGGLIAVVVARNTRRVAEEDLTFDGVDRVEIEIDSGSVRVVARESPNVLVRRRVQYGRRRPATSETRAGTTLRITAAPPRGPLQGWWWIDHVLAVPAGTEVQARTAAGPMAVEGVRGAVDLTSNAGRITVHDCAGALALHSDAGSIEVDGARSKSVTAHTDAGHVKLAFVDAPDDVDATSSGGAVEIALPGGPYRVDASADAGRREVAIATAPDAARSVHAHSDAGSVRVVGA